MKTRMPSCATRPPSSVSNSSIVTAGASNDTEATVNPCPIARAPGGLWTIAAAAGPVRGCDGGVGPAPAGGVADQVQADARQARAHLLEQTEQLHDACLLVARER